MKNFYITTPLYYVNDAPHIGHAYTTVLADILTRYHQLFGYESFFLTGTDEHGQKVQQAAQKRGVDPQAHVDEYNLHFKELWNKMDIQYDHFIRTTDSDHKKFVSDSLQKLWDKGEIYAKEYEGWYSVGEERFFAEEELVDQKDPIGNRPVEWIKEKNYFFKMGKYQEKLIQYIEENPNWILPDFRKNEVLGFLKQELTDLCISRPKSRLSWGIPLPFDTDYVTYVWFDALINYVSAVQNKNFKNGAPLWPASYHLIGKDILTTHAIYWPTMLMALEIPLPTHILAHGWWLIDGSKMSKSSGTGVNPIDYMDQYGVDSFRYFLAREMVVGLDSTFSDDAFKRRINSDLANDLGNLANRVYKLVETHFNGVLPAATQIDSEAQKLIEYSKELKKKVYTNIEQVKLSTLIEDIMSLVRMVNRYLEIKAPWKLAKDTNLREELGTVLFISAEALRISLCFLSPIIPSKAQEALHMLGSKLESLDDLNWGKLKGGEVFGKASVLFPRIEITNTSKTQNSTQKPLFAKDVAAALDLRVAKILSVTNHPNADSLYVLNIDAGEAEPRIVCSGIKSSYSPQELEGRLVLLFANLKAAPLRGVMSSGMILAGETENKKTSLVSVPPESKIGERAFFQNIEASENRELKIKDFQKIQLEVQNKSIFYLDNRLEINQKPLTCEAPDGSIIH